MGASFIRMLRRKDTNNFFVFLECYWVGVFFEVAYFKNEVFLLIKKLEALQAVLLSTPGNWMNFNSVDMRMIERKSELFQNAIGIEVWIKPVLELEPPSPVVKCLIACKLNTQILSLFPIFLLLYSFLYYYLHFIIVMLPSFLSDYWFWLTVGPNSLFF